MSFHVWLRLGKELPAGEVDALRGQFPQARFSVDLEPKDYGTVDAVYTNARLPEDVESQLTSLKWIQTTYGGGASYLTPAVAARGVTVTCSRGVQAHPLSEYAEACVLALAKKMPALFRFQQERRWDESFHLDTLTGKTVGLLGLGAMNSAVAQRLHRQGMRVRAIRRNVNEVPPYVERVVGMNKLPEILADSDFLIIGLPPFEGSQGLIGEAALRSMKKTSFIVNLVTRGIIEDAALNDALRNGWIAGAACNVFGTNPLPKDSPLWDAPNLIISPNVAQTDPQRWQKLRQMFIDNLGRRLQGAAMHNVVDRQGAY
ncbi:MAG TPA: D-2-hydroxyacid dehydrogenase [Alphaproteobacteria bacterium]